MTSQVSKWWKSVCVTSAYNCFRLGSGKNQCPSDVGSLLLILTSPHFLYFWDRRICSLAALSPDEVLRVHSPGHAGHAGPSDEEWHGTCTVYRSHLFRAGNKGATTGLCHYTSSLSSSRNRVSDTFFSSKTDTGFILLQMVHLWITSALKGNAQSLTSSSDKIR